MLGLHIVKLQDQGSIALLDIGNLGEYIFRGRRFSSIFTKLSVVGLHTDNRHRIGFLRLKSTGTRIRRFKNVTVLLLKLAENILHLSSTCQCQKETQSVISLLGGSTCFFLI